MNKVKVLSKPEFNEYVSNHLHLNDTNVKDFPLAFISINDTHGNWSISWFDSDHPNVLRLWFDDVEHDLELSPTNKESCRAFSQEQGKQVREFIDNNKDKDFLVHCSAGISRSGAVGRFIVDYLQGDREYFEKNNPHIHPNGRVSRILNRAEWRESLGD